MNPRLLTWFPGVEYEELAFLENLTKNLTDSQLQHFANLYSVKRKSPDTILLCTLLGFLVLAGIQRFLLGQIGMGILYLFTGGLCVVGTIVDLINYRKMALKYNQKQALLAHNLVSEN